jgi:hypothetical protein
MESGLPQKGASAKKKALVEVDIGKLEMYLVSIQEQLSRHEDELHNPVWWPAFKAEVDQVAVLGRKVEHQALDINIIRDKLANGSSPGAADASSSSHSPGRSHEQTSYGATYGSYGGNASPSHARKAQADPRVDLLAADVEAVKLLVRRIEAQRAVEHTLFSQIRELQRGTRQFQQQLEERAPPEVRVASVLSLLPCFVI